jgi:hypothetical protein
MPWFKCFIHGVNFPGELAGESGLVGFYVARFVEAADEQEAESRVLEGLRAEPKLAPPPGYKPAGIARIDFEEIEEVPANEVPAKPSGFAWHSMEDDA